jgi:hypothetical protein
MQRTFSAAEMATAQQALDSATADIKMAVGQFIEQVADDEITLDPPSGNPLVLPEAPVTAITAIAVKGTPLTHITDYSWTRHGTVWRRRGSWGCEPGSIEVTYTHGITNADREWGVVKRICLDYAARIMDNPTSLFQETVEDLTQQHAKATGLEEQEVSDLSQVLGRILVG